MKRRRVKRKVTPPSYSETAVAKLSAEGYEDVEITQILPTVSSIHTVQKLRSIAREKGILAESFEAHLVPSEVLEEVEQTIQPWSLMEAFQSRVKFKPKAFPRVRRIWSFLSERQFSERDWPTRRRVFARRAAHVVNGLIGRSSHIGIAWGDHLSAIMNSLVDVGKRSGGKKVFYPLRGDPIGGKDAHRTPSVLAASMAEIYGGDSYSLAGLPGVLPLGLSNEQVRAIEALAQSAEGFQRTFSSVGRSLNPAVDCILTSIGVPRADAMREPGYGRVTEEHKLSWNPPEAVRDWELGDIAGVFIGKSGSSAMPSQLKRKWDMACSRWLGVRLEDFERCAAQSEASFGRALQENGGDEDAAALNSTPGVVVISTGDRARAELLIRLVDLGIVNTIICDYSLRRALEESLDCD